jgi:acetyl-CoA C-acetyltransferase
MHKTVYIVGMARTHIGSFTRCSVSSYRAEVRSCCDPGRAGTLRVLPSQVNEVFMGNVVSAGIGQAPAQQASIYAGIPTTVPCTTVNKVCASGMKSIMLGAQSISNGDNDIVVAGGMESMSNIPFYLDKARIGYRLGNGQLADGICVMVYGILTTIITWVMQANYAVQNTGSAGKTRICLQKKVIQELLAHMKMVTSTMNLFQ